MTFDPFYDREPDWKPGYDPVVAEMLAGLGAWVRWSLRLGASCAKATLSHLPGVRP